MPQDGLMVDPETGEVLEVAGGPEDAAAEVKAA
jgi:hypothetical protein